MAGIRYGIVFLLLVRGMYTDVKENRIENRLILAGIFCGLILAWMDKGITGLAESVRAAGIMFAALFFLFVIKGLGAGDIKLFCMLAVFFPRDAVSVLVGSFFAAALLALGKMAVRGIRKQKIYIRKETLPFSIPITIGTLLALIGR